MKPIFRKRGGGNKTPTWIVSFTDMTTLLLSFFIMLQALAKTRDPELFYKGQGGFRRAIAGLGIPDLLFGKPEAPDLGFEKDRHPTEDESAERPLRRVIDAEDDKIRKVFEDLRRLTNAEVSDYRGRPLQMLVTPIAFEPGDATLSPAAGQFLRGFALSLRQHAGTTAPCVYVIALAPDAPDAKAGWMLSARRAKAVETFLAGALPPDLAESGTRITSWGAGPGGRANAAAPETTFVVLAVMDHETRE